MPTYSISENNSAATSFVSGNLGIAGAASVTGVDFAGQSNVNVGNSFAGIFGVLTLNADGSFIYQLNNNDPDTNVLASGVTIAERFSYTYMSNGVSSVGSLAINISGVDETDQVTDTTTNTIYVDVDTVFGSNYVLRSTTQVGVYVRGVAGETREFVNHGAIIETVLNNETNGIVGYSPGALEIVNFGLVDVFTRGTLCHGIATDQPVWNHGIVRAVNDHIDQRVSAFGGQAVGIGASQVFNTGLIDVTSVYGADRRDTVGVYTNYLVNDGIIRVSGPSSMGLRGSTFAYVDNRGTIEATSTHPDGTSIGIYLFPSSSNPYSSATIINSGRIIADQAISATGGYNVALQVTNTGHIEGDLERRDGGLDYIVNVAQATWIGDFYFGIFADYLRNDGYLEGSVNLGWGGDFFDGRVGILVGSVDGGLGSDVIVGGNAGEQLSGGDDADLIEGGGGGDTLSGNSGADIFRYTNAAHSTAASSDLITDFESGSDRLDLSALAPSSVTITVSGAISIVSGTSPSGNFSIRVQGPITLQDILLAPAAGSSVGEALIAGGGGQTLEGLGGNDTLVGGAGDDRLDGGTGNDALFGGAGNDLYILDSSSDWILEGPDGGHDTVWTAADYGLGENVEDAILIGTAPVGIGGNSLDNYLQGNSADNYVNGGDGNDVIYGGLGSDFIGGGRGSNQYIYRSIAESSGASTDHLFVGLNDVVDVTSLNPLSYRFTQPEHYVYSNSSVSIWVDWTFVEIETAAGVATIWVYQDAALANFSVNAPLRGAGSDDTLIGSSSANDLSGLAGSDTLTGLGGVDRLSGGTGDDNFSDTAAGLNGDTITDLATGDRIILTDATLAGFTFNLTGSTLTYSGGSLTLTGFIGTLSASAAVGGGVQLTIQSSVADVRNDFNGDGRSDILWRNVDGQLSNWLGLANGGFTPNNTNAAAVVPVAWQVVGTGDFNGDGRDDILWRNTDGTLSNWLGTANGGYTPNDANAAAAVPTDWHVVGTGDFNGDGRDDILWRNNDGTLSNWLGLASGGFVANDANAAAPVPTAWFVAGTGDFNGDGRDDILWRNVDGQLSNWLGTASGGFTPNNTNAAAAVPTDWLVIGTGDFNGDGRDDILWRNTDGTLSNWLGTANGGYTPNDANAAAAVPMVWAVVAIGDYNGDGRDDILWRHTDGTLSNWLGTASGGFTPNDANAAAPVPTDWHVQPEPFL